MENESREVLLTYNDVVCYRNNRSKIGMVIQTAIDSEEESDSENEEQISEGHVLVAWYPKGQEEEIRENLLDVVNRSLLPGDIVRRANNENEQMKGYVHFVTVNANIKVMGTRCVLKNVKSSSLKPLQEFYPGVAVVLDSWVGVVDDVDVKLTLKLKNGARCIVEGEQVNMLSDITDKRDEDSPFHCELFYPGQSISGSSRVFRDVHWIQGPRPVLSNNQRVTAVVEEVTIINVNVNWRMRGFAGSSNEASSPTSHTEFSPPDFMVAGENLSRLVALDYLKDASIQIGDKAFYVLKETDFEENPTLGALASSGMPSLAEASGSNSATQVDQHENARGSRSKRARDMHWKEKQRQDDPSLTLECPPNQQSNEPNERDEDEVDVEAHESSFSDDSADDEDSDHETEKDIRLTANVSSTSRRIDPRHQNPAQVPRAHMARRRRHFTRKKKKIHVPVKLTSNERVSVEVVSVETIVSVRWQDNTLEENIPSTELHQVLHVDDLEFFPGDFVVDKSGTTEHEGYGVVQNVNSSQRTCQIKWLCTTGSSIDNSISVYDIGYHPDYNFRTGDVVIRLNGEATCEDAKEHCSNQSFPSCGQVTHVDYDGMVNVVWSDQMQARSLPQDLFVIIKEDGDDLSSATNDPTNSDEEWETASDASTDQDQQYQLDPLEDVIMRSLAAIGANNQGNNIQEDADALHTEADQEEPMDNGNEIKHDPEDKQNAATNDVKPKTNRAITNDCHSHGDTFVMLEEAPASHKYFNTTCNPTNPRQFASAIRKEITLLKRHLPNGVIVKAFENRMDLFSILIYGPVGTPYEGGIFIFDLQLPADYPKSPPSLSYLSHCSGRLNPNLYEDGTVCVSLLGTWNGKGTETWTSKSNLSQLILSLQGIILCEEPYYNEAGYEKHKGSREGAENSRMYNEMAIIKMLQSLERIIKSPPLAFKSDIDVYCRDQLPKLLHRLNAWMAIYAPEDFLRQQRIDKCIDEDIQPPDFPLLPLSAGFVSSLFRSIRSLSKLSY